MDASGVCLFDRLSIGLMGSELLICVGATFHNLGLKALLLLSPIPIKTSWREKLQSFSTARANMFFLISSESSRSLV